MKSDTAVARITGFSRPTVTKIRKELRQSIQWPDLEMRLIRLYNLIQQSDGFREDIRVYDRLVDFVNDTAQLQLSDKSGLLADIKALVTENRNYVQSTENVTENNE